MQQIGDSRILRRRQVWAHGIEQGVRHTARTRSLLRMAAGADLACTMCPSGRKKTEGSMGGGGSLPESVLSRAAQLWRFSRVALFERCTLLERG